jgi:hypothetical protein
MSLNEGQEGLKGTKELSDKKVDIVFVWSKKWEADIYVGIFREKYGKKVDVYYDCDSFLQEFRKYPKDTKICFNYTLEDGKTGPQIAEIIYKEGYTHLYLITAYDAEYLKEHNVPDYLKVLFKKDSVNVKKILLDE